MDLSWPNTEQIPCCEHSTLSFPQMINEAVFKKNKFIERMTMGTDIALVREKANINIAVLKVIV